MITRKRVDAERAVIQFARRPARLKILRAVLGNNSGTIDIAGRSGWVWVRLFGETDQVVPVLNRTSIQRQAGLPVDVEEVQRGGKTYYNLLGRSTLPGYSSDPFSNSVGSHGWQHLIGDWGTGGFDPVDVYTRALINLKGHAQNPADMTLKVEAARYGQFLWWAGSTSPAFTPPGSANEIRIDLLYIGDDAALHILEGIAVVEPAIPSYPMASDTLTFTPIAFVALRNGQTEITEASIADARVIFQTIRPLGGSIGSEWLVDDSGGDAAMLFDDDDDILYGD